MAAPVTVSVAWLQEQLQSGGKNIRLAVSQTSIMTDLITEHVANEMLLFSRIVDGSWHMPMWKRDAEAEYIR